MTHAMPRALNLTPAQEAEEDRSPVLVEVLDGVGPHDAVLFIGNRVAAENPALLLEHGVTATMNVAVNIEPGPLVLPDGTTVRRTQIGLIDGHGNVAHHLLAAVLALDGMIGQESPGKAHYPPHRRGNVLVHCRGGRSRSATVLALYLHLSMPDRFATFEDAVDHVRLRRGLGTDQPQPAMMELARAVLARPAVHRLFA